MIDVILLYLENLISFRLDLVFQEGDSLITCQRLRLSIPSSPDVQKETHRLFL